MEQSTNHFSQGSQGGTLTYTHHSAQSASFALRIMRQLEELPWYRETNDHDLDRISAVSVLMQYWSRNLVSRSYAARAATQLLEDTGIAFNHEPSFDELVPYAYNVVDREVMSDFSKFTLLTQPIEAQARDLLHRSSVGADMNP